MPLVTVRKPDSSVSYCVWQISEAEEFFFSRLKLSAEDERLIRGQRLPVRRLEKLACRMALSQLLGTEEIAVRYTPDGQPLVGEGHFSFSHCKDAVAVAFSASQPVGIDIEPIGERILKLYHKFLNDSEIHRFDVTNAEQLHFCWGAKEAMYKLAGGSVENYAENLQIAGIYPHCSGRISSGGNKQDVRLVSEVIADRMVVVGVQSE